MTLASELERLKRVLDDVPAIGVRVFGAKGSPLFLLDFIVAGAIKRTLSLGHGLVSMIESKNMTCGRALVRMQIDTVSRLLAYTYVADPEGVARAVISGTPLNKLKCREGKKLRDDYLIDRMSQRHNWVKRVYASTSGEVHFSEKQFFASVDTIGEGSEGRNVNLVISQFDTKYPESSWSEVAACFSELSEILISVVEQYAAHKVANINGVRSAYWAQGK